MKNLYQNYIFNVSQGFRYKTKFKIGFQVKHIRIALQNIKTMKYGEEKKKIQSY